MQDLVAPLYAQLLVEAAQRLGPNEAFYKLWPVSVPPAPWGTVVTKLYSQVAPAPTLPLQAELQLVCAGICATQTTCAGSD